MSERGGVLNTDERRSLLRRDLCWAGVALEHARQMRGRWSDEVAALAERIANTKAEIDALDIGGDAA